MIFFFEKIRTIFFHGTKIPQKSKEEKRAEIIAGYKAQLEKELSKYKDDKEAYLAKKSQLLKVFSTELSQNIFFDQDEIREILRELALQISI